MSEQSTYSMPDGKDRRAKIGFETAAVSSVPMAPTVQTDVPSFAPLAAQIVMKPE